jgi:hypothetical protein
VMMFPLYRKKKSMKEIWGGEALGARTHGGHVPPPGATGSAEDSTASVLGAQTRPGTALSCGWIGLDASVDAG